MSNQIVLSWEVDVTNTSFGPTQAAAALLAVPLYVSADADPVLSQNFGLTVASDVSSTPGGGIAKRTLTLNMTSANSPKAPSPFPCHPITSTPPEPPYPLRTTKELAGSFFVSNGLTSVPTTATQVPALAVNDFVQFLGQQGVFYKIASVTGSAIGLTTPYNGVTQNTPAFKEVPAPATIVAIYSSSDFDTDAVATVPATPAGPGARTITIGYKDSTGASFSTTAALTGRRPAAVALAGGSVDIAEIDSMFIVNVGGFGNSVGQITLVELSSALPNLPPDLPIGTGIGAAETTVGKVGAPVPRTFKTMTDEAQLLITRQLAYLPQSYFALAQQGASAPMLAGDFFVSTGSANVPTSMDQTGALSAGNTIEFADQEGTEYTVLAVTPKIVTLTTTYTGIDTNNTGLVNTGSGVNSSGTKGNIGTAVNLKPTGATRVAPSPAAPPSDTQLAAPLGQFVALETAAPPLNPPLTPSTVPVPTFLSGLFTQALQLAVSVPVVPQPITFL